MVLARTLIIKTALGPQEVLSAIQPLLIRSDTVAERAFALAEAASDDSGYGDRYLGVVEAGAFRIVRPTLWPPNYRPEATASVRPVGGGSEVQVRLRATSHSIRVFSALSLLVMAAATLFAILELPGPAAWGLGILVVAVSWGSLALAVHNDARRLRNRLVTVLHAGA